MWTNLTYFTPNICGISTLFLLHTKHWWNSNTNRTNLSPQTLVEFPLHTYFIPNTGGMLTELITANIGGISTMYLWWSLCTLFYSQARWELQSQLRSLLSCLNDVFWALRNSLVSWIYHQINLIIQTSVEFRIYPKQWNFFWVNLIYPKHWWNFHRVNLNHCGTGSFTEFDQKCQCSLKCAQL